ncbi:aldo/keto reductase [Actinobacillus succinogenes]|uniref:Aldo/keto reductase n=1 Tax=Actinobacillus succinogenes (strain ATCC 55618 / DSM 22257 / CCUG 43843 / 130Z) TaxID=339671 RepID=A6VNW9_ACTSZ|nr:aldo/keto reductase [Actinobacillus succinogenes]ABR74666.1 aldo/keto reductase [Actinobacillus succinogenes 130Z]PHI40911.1 aldo/keto reductase [Actinobacillus succinogenes]
MLSRRQTLKTLAGALALILLPNAVIKAADSAGQIFHPFDFKKRTVKLNNGIEMPIIGIGVWTLTPEQTEKSVGEALKAGYRLIDTARMYRNEQAVGRAVRDSGIPREEIFITTKIYGSGDYANAEAAINERLRLLDTDYIDLLLLHYPDQNDTKAWKVMEQFVKAGKIRAIGLSNYHRKTFNRIMQAATITPAVVQNEVHIYNQDKQTKAFLRNYGTQMEAWYPLGGRNSYGNGGKDVLFADPTIVSLAKKYAKSPAQVLLRWQLQAGNIAIPGSSNPAHIRENIDIFDFALSDDEMATLSRLDKKSKFSVFGGE